MSEPNMVLEVLDLEIETREGQLESLREARETLAGLLAEPPPAKRKVSRRSAKPARTGRRAAIARSAARTKKGGASGGCGSDAESGHGGEIRRVTCIACGTSFVRCASHNKARGSVKALLEAHKRVCGKDE